MSYKRWDVYFALAPNFEDDKVLSRHPVMIWNDTTAFIVVFKMTSTNRGNVGMEYQLIEWEKAGLDHETSIRLIAPVKIDPKQIQEKVGTVQPVDRLKIENKLMYGK